MVLYYPYLQLQLDVSRSVARNPRLALTLEQPNRLEYLSILQKIVTKDYPTFPATLLPRAAPPLPGIIPVPPFMLVAPLVRRLAHYFYHHPVDTGRGRIRGVDFGINYSTCERGSRGVQPWGVGDCIGV